MNTVVITKNDYNTFFIYVNGEEVAGSSVFRRVRGFWNMKTEKWIKASSFTRKNIKKNPSIVLALLEQTGFEFPQGEFNVTAEV